MHEYSKNVGVGDNVQEYLRVFSVLGGRNVNVFSIWGVAIYKIILWAAVTYKHSDSWVR